MNYFAIPGTTTAIPPDEIINRVARRYGLQASDILSKTRRQPIAEARQYAMFELHNQLGMNYTAIGNFFGMDHATVIHACNVIETRKSLNQLLVR